MVRLGEAMLDVVLAADLVEAVDTIAGGRPVSVAWQVSELDTIIGEDSVQVVRCSLD